MSVRLILKPPKDPQLTENGSSQIGLGAVDGEEANEQEQTQDIEMFLESSWKLEDSLVATKIYVNVCLAFIICRRKLLKGGAWLMERSIDDLFIGDGIVPYEKIMDRNDVSKRPVKLARFPVLRYGVIPQVDKLIEMLDLEIFPAIEQEDIQALQVCITCQETKQDKVLECHNLQFKYSHAMVPGTELFHLSNNINAGDPNFLAVDARSSFQKFLFAIDRMMNRELPKLPRKRFLSLNAFFVQERAAMASFHQVEDLKMWIPAGSEYAQGWSTKSFKFPAQNAGFHEILFHFSVPEDENCKYGWDMRSRKLPDDFASWRKRNRLDEVRLESLENVRLIDTENHGFAAVNMNSGSPVLGTSSSQATQYQIMRKELAQMLQSSAAGTTDLVPTQREPPISGLAIAQTNTAIDMSRSESSSSSSNSTDQLQIGLKNDWDAVARFYS